MMELDAEAPMDDKAKRMRDLLSSFYSPDPSLASSLTQSLNSSSRFATLDTINTTAFDADQYMNLLVQKSNLEGLLQKHVEMAAEIKNLDTDLQMLVYENYNKFISATDTIRRMKNNITGMETNMEQLLEKIVSVQCRSDGVNTSLFKKREHIEKLHCTRNLLRKVQFIYDLPARLEKCIKAEAYADAVKFYTGAMPIFKAYGDSSFEDCKRKSEAAVATIIKSLQGKVFSDSESIQTRSEAVMLLQRLEFPVESLKAKLFEKLEQFLVSMSDECKDSRVGSMHKSSDQEKAADSTSPTATEASAQEFTEAIRAYKVIFLDSEPELSKLAQNFLSKHFEALNEQIKNHIHSEDLASMIRIIWTDVLLMDDVLPEASLQSFASECGRTTVKNYIASAFSHLSHDISGALSKIHVTRKGEIEEKQGLKFVLEASKMTMMQGSLDIILDFKRLVDEDFTIALNLRDSTIVWVLEGFQNFFQNLNLYFSLLCGKSGVGNEEVIVERVPGDKVSPGLVLVLAQLSTFIVQNAIPRITEEIASAFSDGAVRRLQKTIFVPAEACRIFQSSGEMFLNLYIKIRNQRISIILSRRFAAPNWPKHKEPREVHMFVDLLLKEFEETRMEVEQILAQSPTRKHRRTESNGSTTSSRSNPLRDDRLSHSNSQKARSQLLETHLAKLFKQKMEIFTKIEHTQESVLTTIVKLSLKSLQEFVRLQTFNRSGFQQIQLDIHFFRSALKDVAEDEAAVDFLLDEVIVACSERCLDPIPLEPPILERLVHAKVGKTSFEPRPALIP